MTTELNNLRDALLALPPQHVVLINEAFRDEEISNVRELVKEVERISKTLELQDDYGKVRIALDDLYSETSVTDIEGRTMYLHLLDVLKSFERRGTPAPASVTREAIVWDLDADKYVNTDQRVKSRNARRISLTFGFANGKIGGRYVIVGITAKRPFSTTWADGETQAVRFAGWLQGLVRANPINEDEEDEIEDED